MMHRLFGGATLLALLTAGCGGSKDAGKANGTEGGPCYGNGTCNVGLACLSSLCVRVPTPDSGSPDLGSSPANPDSRIATTADSANSAATDSAARAITDSGSTATSDSAGRAVSDSASVVPPDSHSAATDSAASAIADSGSTAISDGAGSAVADSASVVSPDSARFGVLDSANAVTPDSPVSAPSDGPASPTGSLLYSVTCEADGCERTGTLIVTVKSCGVGGAPVATDRKTSVLLSAGTPVSGEIPRLAPGSLCVVAYLDVDASNTQSPGDVVSFQEETAVQVEASQSASASVGLARVVPGSPAVTPDAAVGDGSLSLRVTFRVAGSTQDLECDAAGVTSLNIKLLDTSIDNVERFSFTRSCTPNVPYLLTASPGTYVVQVQGTDTALTVCYDSRQMATASSAAPSPVSLSVEQSPVGAAAGCVYPAPAAQTGSAAITWTIQSQSAASACPASSTVVVTVGTISSGNLPCTIGTWTTPPLAVGSYPISATLSTGSVLDEITGISVSIFAGSVASLPIDFEPATANCDTCVVNRCATESARCASDPTCASWGMCRNACSTSACQTACDPEAPSAAIVSMKGCFDTTCPQCRI